jgi:hypothetical protein
MSAEQPTPQTGSVVAEMERRRRFIERMERKFLAKVARQRRRQLLRLRTNR